MYALAVVAFADPGNPRWWRAVAAVAVPVAAVVAALAWLLL